MSAKRVTVVVGLVSVLSACSGEAPQTASRDAMLSGSADGKASPAAPSDGNVVSYFTGSVDVATSTMSVTFRSPSGGLQAQATLPYGTSAGNVYFHTCGTPSYDVPTHRLSGAVQAVNLTGSSVSAFTAVIDSVSLAGVTPSSGTIASYGTVAANSANCASSQPWVFTNPTDANFTFSGHADGVTGSYSTCAALKTANSSATSGVYSLTAGNAYCDMRAAGVTYRRILFGAYNQTIANATAITLAEYQDSVLQAAFVYLYNRDGGGYNITPNGFTTGNCAFKFFGAGAGQQLSFGGSTFVGPSTNGTSFTCQANYPTAGYIKFSQGVAAPVSPLPATFFASNPPVSASVGGDSVNPAYFWEH